MKKISIISFFYVLIGIFFTASSIVMANVSITEATGGTSISGALAQNGVTPGWTTLGDIVIDENSNGDLHMVWYQSRTLILTAPSNWNFHSGFGSLSTNSADISSSSITVTSTTITVSLTGDFFNSTNEDDQLTISGIQVQAIDGSITSTVNILRTSGNPGDLTIDGVTNNSTNFGSLSSDGILPVELTSFTGSVSNNIVTLKWATATEVNNYGFDVERRVSNTENWQKIGFVAGNGNSNSQKDYSYVDKNLAGGSTFTYRLKQMDNDGAFTYSDAVEVTLVPDKFELYQNYPNPFNPTTNIKFSLPEASRVVINIYNMLGEKVMELANGEFDSGYQEVNLNATGLSSGMYVYSLETQNFKAVKKMVLMK